MKTIITKTEKETFALGEKFAKTLRGGEVIGLIGDLGAGKTVFVKGVAKGLGIKNTITSPTFVLMKVYPVKNHGTIKNLIHIDAYRLKNSNDLKSIGAEEYMNQNDSVLLIEWADKINNRLNKIKNITFKIKNNFRIIIY
jgi:tRNA threonylcarbamoyladenosine biosynthesis protein TsaE